MLLKSFPTIALVALILISCEYNKGVTCTADQRMTTCVSINVLDSTSQIQQEYEISDSLYIDTAGNLVSGSDGEDSLKCFSEITNTDQRIIYIKDGSRIDSTDWFRQESDGCHGEPVLIIGDSLKQP
jgi:hypothetical protein